MEQRIENTFVTVFTGEVWQATMIQNVLDSHEIFAQLKNGLMATIEPWAVTAGGSNPAEVIVRNEDQELAAKIIEEFNNAEPQSEE